MSEKTPGELLHEALQRLFPWFPLDDHHDPAWKAAYEATAKRLQQPLRDQIAERDKRIADLEELSSEMADRLNEVVGEFDDPESVAKLVRRADVLCSKK